MKFNTLIQTLVRFWMDRKLIRNKYTDLSTYTQFTAFIIIFFSICSFSIKDSFSPTQFIVKEISIENQLTRNGLVEISKIAGVNISFHDEMIPIEHRISIHVQNVKLGYILDIVLEDLNLDFVFIANQIVLVPKNHLACNNFSDVDTLYHIKV